ncbi:MAG: hypothetical protein Aurels2KO_50110 [Aureliella sp.]
MSVWGGKSDSATRTCTHQKRDTKKSTESDSTQQNNLDLQRKKTHPQVYHAKEKRPKFISGAEDTL